MPAALMEFGRQAAAQLLFEADAVSGQRARPVSGMYEPIDALRLMLKGTQLRAEERAGGVLIISRDGSRQLAGQDAGAACRSSMLRWQPFPRPMNSRSRKSSLLVLPVAQQ